MPRLEASPGLAVEEVRDLSGLEGLRAEWSALCDRCPWITPFQRPEWLIPWSRCFPPRDLWVLAVREEDRLVGLLPLFLWDDGGTRTLSLMGAGLSDWLDLIAEPGRDVAETVFAWLEEKRGWDVLDLDALALASPLLACPLPPGWQEEVEPREPCPAVALPATVEGLEEVVPTRQRANLRKYRRWTEPSGGWEIREPGPGDVLDLWEALERMHRARWGDGGVLGDPQVRSFHRQVAPGFLARGALAMHGLWLGGRLAAVHYGFQEKDTVFCYLQGFDPEWEKQSPGVLLLGGVIEEAVRRGARTIDFLRGRETYKYHWGARDREARRRALTPNLTGLRPAHRTPGPPGEGSVVLSN